MVRKEILGIDPIRIIVSALMGFAAYIVLIMFFAVLVKFEFLPFESLKIISKLSLFIGSLIGCANVKFKGSGEGFINCVITAFLVLLIAMLCTYCGNEAKVDYAGIIICLLLCELGCFLLFVKRRKNSNLHKRRIKR